jgi:lysine-N-methylase
MRPVAQKIQAQYGSAFRCIGTECEDSCCQGMSVLVDRKTYEGYQGFPEEGLGALVKQYVSIVPAGATDALYARIRPNASGHCPFLSAERLCGVQKEYGSELLSTTCSTYPRALNTVENELEVSLYLSCPQAARQVLLDAESTRAVGYASSGHFRTGQFSRLTSGDDAIHKPMPYFWAIRDLVVAMIQDRRRPMWQRLFLLGMLSKRLNEMTTARDDDAVPEVLAGYWEIVESGGLRDKLEMVPAQVEVQLDVVLRLIDQRIRAGSCGQRFLECFDEFLKGIGYSAGSTAASDALNYREAEVRYCAPFLAERPHILENYLLNYVYRTLFPFGREASAHITPQGIFGEFLLMVTQYALVYGLLVGMAGNARENFGEEDVVRLVQSFSKTVEHSPSYLKEINQLIESRGLGDPQGIATLLKFA